MTTTRLVIRSERKRAAFEVPAAPGLTLLDALLYVQEFQDPTVSFSWNCRTAQCGLCAVRCNENPVLACITRLEGGQTYEVLPIDERRAVRDLVCDVTKCYLSFFQATADRGSERKKKTAFERILFPGSADRW